MLKKKLSDLSFDDKMKVWLHYMATQLSLKHFFTDISIDKLDKWRSHSPESIVNVYPALGVFTVVLHENLKVKDFEDFCAETNEQKSEGLPGWLWRFEDVIFPVKKKPIRISDLSFDKIVNDKDYFVMAEPETKRRNIPVMEYIYALNAYIGLLHDELGEVVPIAAVHGWKSSRFELGQKLRNNIEQLEKIIF